MDIKKTVKDRINAKIDAVAETKPEVVRAIKTSDQYRNFIIGLTNELIKAAAVIAKRGRVKQLSNETIFSTIDDMTEQFVKSFEYDSMVANESDIAKYAREHKDDHLKDMENTLDGNPTGVYEELGVEIVTDREEEASRASDEVRS